MMSQRKDSGSVLTPSSAVGAGYGVTHRQHHNVFQKTVFSSIMSRKFKWVERLKDKKSNLDKRLFLDKVDKSSTDKQIVDTRFGAQKLEGDATSTFGRYDKLVTG